MSNSERSAIRIFSLMTHSSGIPIISRLSTIRQTIDLGLFLPTAGLLLIGLLVTGALSLSDPIALYAEDSTLAWGHVLRAAFALLLMVAVMSIPPERIERAGLVLYLLALAVLITAYFDAFHRFGFGVIHRPWISFDLPLIGERSIEWLSWVQLAIPLALASWMARAGEERWPVAVVTAVPLLVPVFLDGLQFPYRFGWVLISVLLMLAVARWWRSLLLVVLGLPVVLWAVVATMVVMIDRRNFYVPDRIDNAWTPLGRSLEAIGSAGLLGSGWGQGLVSHCVDSRHFPVLGFDRAATMGFTVFTEEFGVVGAVVLIALMLFGSSFLHIASLTRLLDANALGGPFSPRGLALPLVGAGGNVMAINLIAIGLLYRFGRTASPPGPPPGPAKAPAQPRPAGGSGAPDRRQRAAGGAHARPATRRVLLRQGRFSRADLSGE